MWRFIALLVVVLGLAPGTWWRSPLPPAGDRQGVTFASLAMPSVDLGPLALAGAWQLRSSNGHFGSYSALVALDDGTLLAASDRGRMLRFSPPGGPRSPAALDFFDGRGQPDKRKVDLEALTRDRASGRIWAAYEVGNRIARYDAALGEEGSVAPAAMRGWRSALGAEAMVRLADGRFIVLAEGSARWLGADIPGLLFPSDPVAGAAPVRFRFVPPDGFRPVDSAQLPDGRVLILLRKVDWRLPPAFTGKLMLADPETILPGSTWRPEPLADLAAPLPTDNYEGLAAESDGRGGVVLWLISDDNQMAMQRTLLLKLTWPANAKARGISRAPR